MVCCLDIRLQICFFIALQRKIQCLTTKLLAFGWSWGFWGSSLNCKQGKKKKNDGMQTEVKQIFTSLIEVWIVWISWGCEVQVLNV